MFFCSERMVGESGSAKKKMKEKVTAMDEGKNVFSIKANWGNLKYG